MKARSILLAAAGALAMTSLAAPCWPSPMTVTTGMAIMRITGAATSRGSITKAMRPATTRRAAYYAPPPPVVYAPPQAYYAPPPPVVYGSPGVTFGITIP